MIGIRHLLNTCKVDYYFYILKLGVFDGRDRNWEIFVIPFSSLGRRFLVSETDPRENSDWKEVAGLRD